ncbi:MAG: hypothetical protein U1E15_08180 [Hyphomicrobiales bacterium]
MKRGDFVLLEAQASWQPGMVPALAGFRKSGRNHRLRRHGARCLRRARIRVGKVSYVTSQFWPFMSLDDHRGEAESDDHGGQAELEDAAAGFHG